MPPTPELPSRDRALVTRGETGRPVFGNKGQGRCPEKQLGSAEGWSLRNQPETLWGWDGGELGQVPLDIKSPRIGVEKKKYECFIK